MKGVNKIQSTQDFNIKVLPFDEIAYQTRIALYIFL